jgi:hypothetical protein
MVLSYDALAMPRPASQNSPPQVPPVWVGLVPWLVYALGLRFLPVVAPAFALTTGLILARHARTALNPLDVGVLAYFLLLTGLAFSATGRDLSPSVQFALCPAVLAVASAVSVALRHPFTLAYAYPYVPQHLRDQPAFFLANQWISLLWMTGFAAAALIILLLPGAWSAARGGIVLGTTLAITAGASALLGAWFHFRQPSVALNGDPGRI